MGGISFAVLALIGLVAFNNYKNGTLGPWLGAKFLNKAPGQETSDESPYSISNAFLTTTPQTPATGIGGGLGNLLAPVVGAITGIFGEDRTTHNHAGIDYAVSIGTPVHAARSGVVSFAGNQSGYGLLVIIDHGGGVSTKYAHLSQILTSIGSTVRAGDVIAKSGNTGRSTGPHLHFELTQGGKAIDPNPYLGGTKSVGAALTSLGA